MNPAGKVDNVWRDPVNPAGKVGGNCDEQPSKGAASQDEDTGEKTEHFVNQ